VKYLPKPTARFRKSGKYMAPPGWSRDVGGDGTADRRALRR
jgi:hypothetical protein